MIMVRIAPVKGRVVLMPERNYKPLPDGGTNVAMSSHYRRAIANGDVVVVKDNPEPTAPKFNKPKNVSAPTSSGEI